MDDNKQPIAETPEVTPEETLQDVIAKANELDEKAEEASNEEVKTESTEEKPATETPEPEVTKPAEDVKPTEPEKPLIDEEKLTNNIVDKFLEATKKTQTPEQQDELSKAIEDLELKAKAEGRQVTYKEALKVVSEVSTKKAKEEILAELQREADEEDKAEQEAKAAQEEQYKAAEKSWNTYWDGQLGELEADGKIPKGEEGKKIRLELFETMKKVAEERQAKGQQPILNLKEIFAFHYTPKEQPGKQAPVFGAEKSISNTVNMPTDEQLSKMDLRQVRELADKIDNS